MPGQSASATIRLRPPRASTTPAGAHPLIVEARPVDRPGIAARADAIVDVAPFDLIAARVVPHQAKRWKRSEHRLELTNSGNAPVLVDVAATDADDLLWFRPLPQQASVPPGSRVALRFSASARSWRLLGRQPAAREFTVSATSREGTTVTAPGVLRQRALITFVTALLALIALLLIVLIARGLNP
jgi:hypothetical protein